MTPDWLYQQYKAFSSRKRDYQACSSDQSANAKERRVDETSGSNSASAHMVSGDDANELEVNNFLNSLRPHAFVVDDAAAFAAAVHLKGLHSVAFIDSQASSFVVPSAEYLSRVTNSAPTTSIDTANGSVRPECVGDMVIKLQSDDGDWHTFEVNGVWVLPSCNRMLYSQSVMHRMGIMTEKY